MTKLVSDFGKNIVQTSRLVMYTSREEEDIKEIGKNAKLLSFEILIE